MGETGEKSGTHKADVTRKIRGSRISRRLHAQCLVTALSADGR